MRRRKRRWACECEWLNRCMQPDLNSLSGEGSITSSGCTQSVWEGAGMAWSNMGAAPKFGLGLQGWAAVGRQIQEDTCSCCLRANNLNASTACAATSGKQRAQHAQPELLSSTHHTHASSQLTAQQQRRHPTHAPTAAASLANVAWRASRGRGRAPVACAPPHPPYPRWRHGKWTCGHPTTARCGLPGCPAAACRGRRRARHRRAHGPPPAVYALHQPSRGC